MTPTAFQLTLTGDTAPVLGSGTGGQVLLTRDGAAGPVAVDFENGALTITDLQPGQYSVTAIGPLVCRGLTFDIAPSSGARALGSLRARIVTTDYYVALMSHRPATGDQIARLVEHAPALKGEIDARPISQTEAAPCYLGTGGPATTWHDLPLGQKIILGVGIAGFCAIALASGGICAY